MAKRKDLFSDGFYFGNKADLDNAYPHNEENGTVKTEILCETEEEVIRNNITPTISIIEGNIPDDEVVDYIKIKEKQISEDSNLQHSALIAEQLELISKAPVVPAKVNTKLGTTQGKKGQKLKRINMAFEDDIYDYLKLTSRQQGKTMTEFVNEVLREKMNK